MKTSPHIIRKALLFTLTVLLLAPAALIAQAKFHGVSQNISVTGTSTLHDWEMKSNKALIDAVITVTNNVVTFSALTFAVPAVSLKSGHSLMDKNTYKAINIDKNPNITFTLSNVTSITTSGLNTYIFKGTGKLTIAGATKVTDVIATLKYNPTDKSFTCTGTKKFKMSEYGVKPPTVMMGTIKTGDAIAIHYSVTIKS